MIVRPQMIGSIIRLSFGIAFASATALCQTQFSTGWCSPAIAHVGGSVEVYTGNAPEKTKGPKKPGTLHGQGERVFQSTEGDASPVIADVRGNVKIVCNGINPLAVERLNKELNKVKVSEQLRLEKANEWAQKYKDQEASLAKWQVAFRDLPPIRKLVDKAARLLQKGDLEQSGEVLEQLSAKAKEIREQATLFDADITFEIAQNLDLQFRFTEALKKYEECYQESPGNIDFAFSYAIALDRNNKREQEETVYLKILDTLPVEPPPSQSDPTYDLWAVGATKNDLRKGKVLNNLAGLFVANGQLNKLTTTLAGGNQSDPGSDRFRMVEFVERVFREVYMRGPISSGPEPPEVKQLILKTQLNASELAALNNRLIIAQALARHSSISLRIAELPRMWEDSLMQLTQLFQDMGRLNKLGAKQFINGDAAVNSFEALMNLTEFACHQLDDTDFSTQSAPTAQGPPPGWEICLSLPQITEQFLTSIRELNLVFYAPVAAQRYSVNFRLLATMKTDIVAQLIKRSPQGNWASSLEDEGVKAETTYVSLSSLNSELYAPSCISFLRDEAAYYKNSQGTKAQRVESEIKDIETKVTTHVVASSDSYGWIMYYN